MTRFSRGRSCACWVTRPRHSCHGLRPRGKTSDVIRRCGALCAVSNPQGLGQGVTRVTRVLTVCVHTLSFVSRPQFTAVHHSLVTPSASDDGALRPDSRVTAASCSPDSSVPPPSSLALLPLLQGPPRAACVLENLHVNAPPTEMPLPKGQCVLVGRQRLLYVNSRLMILARSPLSSIYES